MNSIREQHNQQLASEAIACFLTHTHRAASTGAHTYTGTYTWWHSHTLAQTLVHTHTYWSMHTHTLVYTHWCTHTYIHTLAHTHIHAYTHTHTMLHTHTHTHILLHTHTTHTYAHTHTSTNTSGACWQCPDLDPSHLLHMGELWEDFLPQLSKGDNGLVHNGFGFAQHRVKLDAPSQSLKRTWVLNTRSVKKTSLTGMVCRVT